MSSSNGSDPETPFRVADREWSAALPAAFDGSLLQHLIRDDEDEDLTFALWSPSEGRSRTTALVHSAVFPVDGDRQRHGNVSFNPEYLRRACETALRKGCGVALLHSHPGPGWQGMSMDDVKAESGIAGTVLGVTEFPLIGLTVGNDGTWSGRVWDRVGTKQYKHVWFNSVRTVGERLQAHFANHLVRLPEYREEYKRTLTVWGQEAHAELARRSSATPSTSSLRRPRGSCRTGAAPRRHRRAG